MVRRADAAEEDNDDAEEDGDAADGGVAAVCGFVLAPSRTSEMLNHGPAEGGLTGLATAKGTATTTAGTSDADADADAEDKDEDEDEDGEGEGDDAAEGGTHEVCLECAWRAPSSSSVRWPQVLAAGPTEPGSRSRSRSSTGLIATGAREDGDGWGNSTAGEEGARE